MYDITFFEPELMMIKDELLRDLMRVVLTEHTPKYFWSVSASITSKHHPFFSNGNGGLCRHTKYGFHMAERIADYNEKIQKDIVRCAFLGHDIAKYGYQDDINDDRWGFKMHGQVASAIMRSVYYRVYGTKPDDIFKGSSPLLSLEKDWLHVCDCVETHNGRWTVEDGSVLPKTKEAWVVHFADMAASANLPKEIFEYEKEQE